VLPMMDPEDVRVMEEALLSRRERGVGVLEWGCGGSTAWFQVPLAPRRRAGNLPSLPCYRFLCKTARALRGGKAS